MVVQEVVTRLLTELLVGALQVVQVAEQEETVVGIHPVFQGQLEPHHQLQELVMFMVAEEEEAQVLTKPEELLVAELELGAIIAQLQEAQQLIMVPVEEELMVKHQEVMVKQVLLFFRLLTIHLLLMQDQVLSV